MILDVEQHRTRFVSRFHLSSRKKHRSRLVKMDDFWHGSPSMHPFPSPPFSFAFFAFVRFFSSFFNATPRFILLTALFVRFSCVSYFFIFFFSFFFLFFSCVLCSFLSFSVRLSKEDWIFWIFKVSTIPSLRILVLLTRA